MSPAAPPPVDILAIGLVTPVGLDAPSAAAALRAGVNRVRETHLLDRDLEPIRMALVAEDALPPLADPLGAAPFTWAHGRMIRLAGAALQQAAPAAGAGPVPLFLALPEAVPGAPDPVGESFLADLVTQAEAPSVLLPASKLHREGGAAGLLALRAALEWLSSGGGDTALVGAVDSPLDAMRLAALDGERRLLSDRATDGFIPGEGAAMLLVGTPDAAARIGLAPLARVLGVGAGVEPGHRYAKEPYRGDGLAAAFQDVFAAAPSAPPVRCVYAGFNGESFPAKEWGVAYLRSSERFAKDCRVEHPADCIGDAGAALGPIMLALAATGLSRGYRGSPCLVWSTSDREPRAAALVAAAT